jgi:uncharacterized repeat protein (TIGR04138 family)
MSLRDALARVLARDPRYSIHAYIFVFEALEYAKTARNRARARVRARDSGPPTPQHVNGRELCEAARNLALRRYGLLALTVLRYWGVYSTSDIGEIVYNLIRTGDLERSPSDARSDFDSVFDFGQGFCRDYALASDEVA